MNKTAIKNYAIWARVQLIEAAKQKAYEYAVTDGENIRELNAIGGRLLTDTEKKQRRELLDEIRQKGYQQVMEEAAYTWFNRFIALRFMEVNGYLPSMVRVFTDETGAFKPEILKEAMNVELEGLDRAKVLDLIDKQDNDALYQYLLITQCNALNDCLPRMFERIDNWTELLFPKNLLRPDGVLGKMISMIPEEDWTDQVQIIGWLYQAYYSDPKDERINAHKKYTSNDIPYVTQLFTPDWIVRYMVENSLGRLWYESHRDFDNSNWKYYLNEVEQEPEIETQLKRIRAGYATIRPEEIKLIDPCMGSGHILVYAFDVLMQIYASVGWTERDAAKSILENNLYGLDIDDRAGQLAYFAVMMKARRYNRRILNNRISPHVLAIQDSSFITDELIYFVAGKDNQIKNALAMLRDSFKEAKEYGSLVIVPEIQFEEIFYRIETIQDSVPGDLVHIQLRTITIESLLPFLRQAQYLSSKYHVVVTNPPYMNSALMPDKLKQFVSMHYRDYKSDLFAAFTKKAVDMCTDDAHIGLLLPYVWMFISSYEKMRFWFHQTMNITSLVQLEYNAFEAACVPVATFTAHKTSIKYFGEYVKLSRFRGADNQEPKLLEAICNPACGYRYSSNQKNYQIIPGSPFAFWVSNNLLNVFRTATLLGSIAESRQGLATTDNKKFLRLWYEICFGRIGFGFQNTDEAKKSKYRWFPYNKGGDFRKWYGNNDYVVNYENDGQEIKDSVLKKYPYLSTPDFVVKNTEFYFKPSASWSLISSTATAFRIKEQGFIFDVAGMSLFSADKLEFLLALCNTKIVYEILNIIAPTINFQCGDIAKIPVILPNEETKKRIETMSKECIALSKIDWDSFETSWDFRKHPLVPLAHEKKEQEESQWGKDRMKSFGKIEHHYNSWAREAEDRFNQLKAYEEELNRIFIDIYGLQDELKPEVEYRDVTVRKADLGREIRSLISYAVGCMFGRYSLDVPGLAYAGGAWDSSKYKTFIPDADNVLPICDDEYFEDDIVGRFVEFIEVAYGKESLEENLKFISDALGGKGIPRQVIRNYFLNEFYADHCNEYSVTGSGKRPIYWLFDSGKKNGFKCLIYMHRYQPDTIARIRTDYVHEQQERYRSQIRMIEDTLQTASAVERVKLNKQLTKFKDQALELQKYEEKIHHLADQAIPIDLDDGVKVNYAKFEDVLAKVK